MLQSMGSERVGYDLATEQPPPVVRTLCFHRSGHRFDLLAGK